MLGHDKNNETAGSFNEEKEEVDDEGRERKKNNGKG